MDDLRYQVDLLTALNQKLQAEERMYRLFFDTSQRAFLYINYENGSARTLGSWNTFFDMTINEAARLPELEEYFSEESKENLRRLLFVEKEGKSRQALDCKLKDEKTWVCVDVSAFKNASGEVVEKIVAVSDVTRQKNHQEELSYMAYYDSTTGLYNRNYFITKLKDYVDKAKESNVVVSVMLIDIDDFHNISDVRGIVTGDEIIQNLGIYIRGLTEDNVIASRFDSDIFCIAIFDPCGHRSVDTIYRSIKEYLGKPMKLTDMTDASISVSVGVAEYPESSDDALSLINCAEIVMYKAKKQGKNTIKFFDTAILNNFLNEVNIENKLKEAVLSSSFYMNYQPQFYAGNKRLRGVEALIRWKDSDGNMISPSVFLPLAERNGTIIPIGDFVLNESIRQFMEWKKKFDLNIVLSINISSIQYTKPDFVPKIMAALNKYDMNPELLELEVTESVLIDDFKQITDKMLELRDYGIKVSLDDFGTGFSSLSYLRGLPISTLKIDKSFIDNVLKDDTSKIIIETVINMSKKLGFETVAEGVETKEQLEYFTENTSCDLIQGYYLGRPTDEKGIEELMLRII
ncbi:MAG: GGDEF domain-containing protein [Lachnospiraceae bacterium]|nr:GGDEF domain-containing protein [Lachnospiraceae bacterium]